MKILTRRQIATIAIAVVASAITGLLTFAGASPVIIFVLAAVALATLAATVGEATDQLSQHLSAGATGVVQSALGNLPELFVSLFALRAGLIGVVQASIIGSILGNSLLVLGLAFLIGGRRHGTLRFDSVPPRTIATLTLLAISALVIPTLAFELHVPASAHEATLSLAVAIVLLLVFAASIPVTIQGGAQSVAAEARVHENGWPLSLTIGILAVSGVGAALVSDWFVEALQPAIEVLHLSEAFAGLVVVALAGNAVENVVGVQLALQNRADLAISVILNSSLQIASAADADLGAGQFPDRRRRFHPGDAPNAGRGCVPGGPAGGRDRVRWPGRLAGGRGPAGALRHDCGFVLVGLSQTAPLQM